MNEWRKKSNVQLIEQINLPKHNVRIYPDRLAIWRHDGKRQSWDELQAIKQEIWGDIIAVEIYPADVDVVNLRNTRHLWHNPELEDIVSLSCRHPEFDGLKSDA